MRFVLAPGMTVRSLFPVLLCLVGQSFKDRTPRRGAQSGERDLYPLRRRGVPFSFAGAKVRRLFQTTKCFDNFFAKFFPQGDLCQLTRARTFNNIRKRALGAMRRFKLEER